MCTLNGEKLFATSTFLHVSKEAHFNMQSRRVHFGNDEEEGNMRRCGGAKVVLAQCNIDVNVD